MPATSATSATLDSWNDGPARQAILDFVAAVTAEGGPEFVPPHERVAVFDNDGTLWCEQPMQVQAIFAHERAVRMALVDPSLKDRQPFKAFLDHDLAAIHSLGKRGILEFALAIHSGMTVKAFADLARDWLTSGRHPVLKRPYTEVVYQPQLDLLRYLRAHGFKTFIVSGGGADFIRAIPQNIYGIPPDQVIGSMVKLRFDASDSGPCELMKLPELDTFNDREAKAENIGRQLGCRPVLAFGNSDGDLAMLRYTASGDGRRLALLLHHDDASRERAYDREFRLSPLAEALDRADEFGIHVVSMKNDWATVFP